MSIYCACLTAFHNAHATLTTHATFYRHSFPLPGSPSAPGKWSRHNVESLMHKEVPKSCVVLEEEVNFREKSPSFPWSVHDRVRAEGRNEEDTMIQGVVCARRTVLTMEHCDVSNYMSRPKSQQSTTLGWRSWNRNLLLMIDKLFLQRARE